VASAKDRKKVEGIKVATWDSYDHYDLFTDETGEHIIAIVENIGVDVDEIFEHKIEGVPSIQQMLEQWIREEKV
jgi:hypothetical protein